MKTKTRSINWLAILAIVCVGALGACNTNDTPNPSITVIGGGDAGDTTGSTDGDGGTNPDSDGDDGTNPDSDSDGGTNPDGDGDGGTNPDGDGDGDGGTNPDGDVLPSTCDSPIFTVNFTSTGGGWTAIYYVKGGSSTVEHFDLVDSAQNVEICPGEESGLRFIITWGDQSPPAPIINVTTNPGHNFFLYFGNVGEFGTDPNLVPIANPAAYNSGQSLGPYQVTLDYFITFNLP